MTFPTELKKITVRSIPTEKSRARERTYDAQILVLGDFVDFYITSATKRDIQNRDHLKLEDIGFVACDGRTFLVERNFCRNCDQIQISGSQNNSHCLMDLHLIKVTGSELPSSILSMIW